MIRLSRRLESSAEPLLSESFSVATPEIPQWALAPRPLRVAAIDRALRKRLADSFCYLAEFATLDDLVSLEERLKAGPVSPWVFVLYSKLVAELSNNPRGDGKEVFDAVLQAASRPGDECLIAFRDPAVSTSWWDHLGRLLDTDRERLFKLQSPCPEGYSLCKDDVERALALMRRSDPEWYDEVRQLLRMCVLGSPVRHDVLDFFNGASTFFLWGGVLINADVRRTAISMTDLLVHESSHVLLYGLSAEGALTHNTGRERYASPLRSDPRPIDGIFHACFVATRVHLAMGRLLESGCLSPGEAREAVERREFNGNAARISLDVLSCHAKPTKRGERIFDILHAYWAGGPSN